MASNCDPYMSNSKFPSYQSSRSFLVADTNLCLYVSKFQVTRVPEVFWLKIMISACMFQSYKLPEFQKFFGRRYRSLPVCCKVPRLPEFQKFFGLRYRSLPVCCKVPSYQSSRSFFVADNDLCLSVSKFPSYQSSRSFLVADTDLCLSVAKFPSYQSFRSFFGAEL